MRQPSPRLGLGGAALALLVTTSAASAIAAPLATHPKTATHQPGRATPRHVNRKHKKVVHVGKPVAHPATSLAMPAAKATQAMLQAPAALPISVPLPIVRRSASATPAPSTPAPSTPAPSTPAPSTAPRPGTPSTAPRPGASSGTSGSASATTSATPTATTPPGPGASTAPGPGASTAPTTTNAPIALGVTVASDDDAGDVAAYTNAAGRNPAILMWYSNWGGPIAYGGQMAENDSVGSTPMVTWDPTDAKGNGISLSDIAAGSYDGYLDYSASLSRQYGKPMLVRFAHEMNLSGSPYGPGKTGDTARSFVAAWQHVVSRFAADQATNVRWVWSPNVDCGGGCPFDAFYPGDGYVDYVALDGYNFASVHSIAPESFTEVFGESYTDLLKLTTKPAMIAETATAGSDSDKASWLTSAFTTEIPNYFPGLKAVIWFDRNKEFDWRVNADAQTLSAWQNVVASPGYQAPFSW